MWKSAERSNLAGVWIVVRLGLSLPAWIVAASWVPLLTGRSRHQARSDLMRESRLGRWVARISVTFGLGAAVLGGVAVLLAGFAGGAPASATVGPAFDFSFRYTRTTTVPVLLNRNKNRWGGTPFS